MLIWTFPCQKVISLLAGGHADRARAVDPSPAGPRRADVGVRPGRGPGPGGPPRRAARARRRGHAAPCGTSRWPPCGSSPRPGQQDPGEQGTGVVVRGGPHHLAHRLRPGPPRAAGRWPRRSARRRGTRPPEGPQLEVRAGGRDGDVVVVVGEGHRAGLEPAHDVGREPRRNDTRPVFEADDLFGHLDGQIEVGAGDREDVAECTTAEVRTAPEMMWRVHRRRGRRWPASRRVRLARIGTSPERVLSAVSPVTA